MLRWKLLSGYADNRKSWGCIYNETDKLDLHTLVHVIILQKLGTSLRRPFVGRLSGAPFFLGRVTATYSGIGCLAAEWVAGVQGPFNPYKPCNYNLYTKIITFFH